MLTIAEIVNSRGKVLHTEDISHRRDAPDLLDVRIGDSVWEAELTNDLPRLCADEGESELGTAVYTYRLLGTLAR